MKKIKVHIICYDEDSWILEKFARKLCEGLLADGIQCAIGKKPDLTADINHHINYWGYDGRRTTTETIMITHIDTQSKLDRVRFQLLEAEMGVCLSAGTVEMLVNEGIPRSKLCAIHQAHDGIVRPRKTIIGITCRVYPDGRKREGMLLELAASISPEDFAFRIMGQGWDKVVARLREGGFDVDYSAQFDRELYYELMPQLDYYLYLGFDEGSMGFIDALAAGVATIVTPQGYHLDAPGGITHAFTDTTELKQIFHDIVAEKKMRQKAVADWTWARYARNHQLLWEYVLTRKSGAPVPELLLSSLREIGFTSGSQGSVAEGGDHPPLRWPTVWSAMNKAARFRGRKPAPFWQGLNSRVTADGHVEHMQYLLNAGAKTAAVKYGLRAIATRPYSIKVWRQVLRLSQESMLNCGGQS